MTKEEDQSLIGVQIVDGRVVRNTRHRDGTEEHRPLETDAFGDLPEADRPHTCHARNQGALEDPHVGGLTRAQHVERSVRVEAALLKTLEGARGRLLNPGQIRAVLAEILHAVGGQWSQYTECLGEYNA